MLGDTGHVIDKKWGWEEVLVNDREGNYCLKRLCVVPMAHSSVHRHLVKHETFIVETGRLHVFLSDGSEDRFLTLLPGQKLVVRPGTWHCFWSHEPASFYEVSTCHADDDVERKTASGPFEGEGMKWCNEWKSYPGNHNILVVGDSMLDEYLFVTHGKPAQEAAIARLHLGTRKCLPGGAAHVAALLAKSGAKTTLFSCVGDDTEGVVLHGLLEEAGVNPLLVPVTGRRTAVRQRTCDGTRLLHRLDTELGAVPSQLTESFEAYTSGQRYSAVIVCDHGKGVLIPGPTSYADDYKSKDHILGLIHGLSDHVVLDPSPNAQECQVALKFLAPWLLKCNQSEAIEYIHSENGRWGEGAPLAQDLMSAVSARAKQVVVTGESGCTWSTPPVRDEPSHVVDIDSGIVNALTSAKEGGHVFASRFPSSRAGVDVVGAGDEFLAKLVIDLLGGAEIHDAVTGAHLDLRQRVQVPRLDRWPWA